MRRRRRNGWAVAARRLPVAAAGGLALLLLAPARIAEGDVAALLLKSFDPSARWAIALGPGPGGVTELVTHPLGEMQGSATVTAGGGEIVVEGTDPIVTGSIDATAAVPDEDRIDRSWKGDLPITITTPATAPGFSAGSLFQEHSRLEPPVPGSATLVAFSKADLPLSVLAVGRFIGPRAPLTDVALLDPVPPLPSARPDATLLTEAGYPRRAIAPAAANQAAEAMLAAYAPDSSVVGQDMFDALFATPAVKPPVPPIAVAPGDFWWAANPLPASAYTEPEQQCLAEAVYFESRGEPEKGQIAVAQVVLNRVRNPAYPDTICKVVYQNKDERNACQFSFACDGIRDVVHPGYSWTRAQQIAKDVTFGGESLPEIGTATHYHAVYVRPNWAGVFHKKAKIGRHVFYQTIYGGWG